jgi:glycosyltransferase involved in cell wall biosynthesis
MSKIPNVVIISDQEKDRNSGINGVLRNTIPHLREKMDVGWKVVSGLFVYRNNFLDNHLPALIKLIIVTLLSLIKLLFSRKVWNADIINAHGISSWVPAILLSKLLHKTIIVTLHETYSYTELTWFFGDGAFAKWVWNFALNKADYFITVSRAVQLENSFYVPNGVNSDVFKSNHKFKEKREKIVLYVGRLSKEKGIDYFIASSQLVRNRLDVKFVVIAPVAKKIYIEVLEKNDIECHVGVSLKELVAWYQKADIFVLPSSHEAFPLVILEAMACETPVVASSIGDIPDIIQDGATGFLVEPGSSEELSQKIIELLEDDELRERMGKRARSVVKAKYDWKNISTMIANVYEKVLATTDQLNLGKKNIIKSIPIVIAGTKSNENCLRGEVTKEVERIYWGISLYR